MRLPIPFLAKQSAFVSLYSGQILDALDETNLALGDLRKELVSEREKNAKLRSDVEVLRVMIRSQSVGITRSNRGVT